MSLVVSLWLKGDDVAGLEAFERAAAEVMAKHGGRIARTEIWRGERRESYSTDRD